MQTNDKSRQTKATLSHKQDGDEQQLNYRKLEKDNKTVTRVKPANTLCLSVHEGTFRN
jgi:hypothetical protein